MNIFERAARRKLRFSSGKGEATVEDLFDLSLPSLDQIARAVNKRLKEEGEESFISPKPKATTVELELKMDILKHVISAKQSEAEAAKARADKKANVDFLKSLIEQKKLDQLKGTSLEDLEKRLAEAEQGVAVEE